MKEITQLLTTFVGAVVGFGVGMLGWMAIYRAFPEQLGRGGSLPLVVGFSLGGGGMIGGGYLALWITTKVQKARQRKKREQRTKFGNKRRK